MFLSLAFALSLASHATLERLASRVCAAPVHFVKLYGDAEWRDLGYVDEKGEIYVSKEIGFEAARLTILHECCHVLYAGDPVGPFGRPPYVNEYASTDPEEDRCETYAYHRAGKLSGRKERYWSRMLSK